MAGFACAGACADAGADRSTGRFHGSPDLRRGRWEGPPGLPTGHSVVPPLVTGAHPLLRKGPCCGENRPSRKLLTKPGHRQSAAFSHWIQEHMGPLSHRSLLGRDKSQRGSHRHDPRSSHQGAHSDPWVPGGKPGLRLTVGSLSGASRTSAPRTRLLMPQSLSNSVLSVWGVFLPRCYSSAISSC